MNGYYKRVEGNRIPKKGGVVYHFTKRSNLESILTDGCLKIGKDIEVWVCRRQNHIKIWMENTVMIEGMGFIAANGIPKRYPKFEMNDNVILKLILKETKPENWVTWVDDYQPEGNRTNHQVLGLAHRGDLVFESCEVIEAKDLLDASKIINLSDTERKAIVKAETQNAKMLKMFEKISDLMLPIANEMRASMLVK